MADDTVSGSGGLGDVDFDDSGTATGIDDGGDDDDNGSGDLGGGGPEGGASARYGSIDTPSGPEDIQDERDDAGGTGAPEGDNDERSDFGRAMEGFRESADAGELEGQDQASGEAREDLNETVGAYLAGDVSDEELNESVESFLNEGDGGGAGGSQQGQDPGDVSVDPGNINVDESETASGGIDPGDIDADESQVDEADTSPRQPAGSGSPIEESGSGDTVSGSGGLGDVEFDESGRATGVNAGGGDSGRGDDADRSDFGRAMEGFRESAEAGELEGQPGGDGAMRDTQLEQETGVSTDDVRSGQAAAPPTATEDLTRVDQELGSSGDETSGFEDPDQIEGGLSGVRFANERTAEATPGEQTTVAGETFERGQALPTERQIARDLEREAVDESPSLGREDIAVVRGDGGLAVDLTGEGEEQVQRQREYKKRQARIEARQAAERDLEAQLSVSQRPGQAGPGGVEFSPVDLQQGEDFTFEERPGGGVRTELTDSFLKERAANIFRERLEAETGVETAGLQPGEQFRVDVQEDGVETELTPEGRRAVSRSIAAEEGELGGQRVTDLDQIKFDDQGNVEEIEGVPIAPGLGDEGAGAPSLREAAGDTVAFTAFGPAGVIANNPEESASGLELVRDTSQDATEELQQEVVNPIAGYVGEGAESIPLRPTTPFVGTTQTAEDIADSEETGAGPETAAGRFSEEFTQGLGGGAAGVTVGAPAMFVTTGSTVGAGGAYVVENPDTAGAAAAGFVGGAAADTAKAARENPARFTGNIIGGAVAGSAISPIRFSRTSIPRTGDGTRFPRPTRGSVDVDTPIRRVESGEVPDGPVVFGREINRGSGNVDIERPRLERPQETNVRGVRVRDPVVVEALRGRADPGTTVVGFRGARPTRGAPDVDVDSVRFGDMGGRGETAEPVGAFESEVFRKSVGERGGRAADRFQARRSLMQMGRETEGELQLETTEEIVGEARSVPDSAKGEVADALEDVGATIEGSAAVRAQVDDPIRQPRDVDILLDEQRQAPKDAPIEEQFPESGPRLRESLEGEQATVNDVFDIKVAGEERPSPGQFVKGGQVAQRRLETEGGVQVTQIGEELTRKASASGFLRGPGSPAEEFVGRTGEFDVGPEPARAGERPRFKDPADAFEIGRRVDPDSEAVQRFGQLFEREISESARGPNRIEPMVGERPAQGRLFGRFGDRLRLRDLAEDERARVDIGFRRGDLERPRSRGDGDGDTGDIGQAGRRGDTDVSSSSPTRGDVESPSPVPTGPASSGSVGSGGQASAPSRQFSSSSGVSSGDAASPSIPTPPQDIDYGETSLASGETAVESPELPSSGVNISPGTSTPTESGTETAGGDTATTSPSTTPSGGQSPGQVSSPITTPGGGQSPGQIPSPNTPSPGSVSPGGFSGGGIPTGAGIPTTFTTTGPPNTAYQEQDVESDSDEKREDIEFNKSPPAADSNLGPGWFAEYVTAVALGATADRSNPGESVLEGRPAAKEYTSTLPVESQVSGTEEEQEAIQEAYEALTFGDGGSVDDGDPFDFVGSGGGWF